MKIEYNFIPPLGEEKVGTICRKAALWRRAAFLYESCLTGPYCASTFFHDLSGS